MLVTKKSNKNGISMYSYGISEEDIYGRESLDSLLNKGKISKLDYISVVRSSSSILLEPLYWDQFPKHQTTIYSHPTNHTPKGYVRKGKELINLRKRQDDAIKFAKRKVKSPNVVVRDSHGRVSLVPRQG